MTPTATSTTPAQRESEEAKATGIVWEDPPAETGRTRSVYPWAAWARMLKRHPMRWAKLVQFERPSTARNKAFSKERREHLPRGEFEVRAGLIGDSGSALWARYIGGDDDD